MPGEHREPTDDASGHRAICDDCGKHHYGTNPPQLVSGTLRCRECNAPMFEIEGAA